MSNHLLYRSMKKDSMNLPEVENSARGLGAREYDIPVVNSMVRPGTGGISVSPDSPLHLPRHRRPGSLQGIGKDPVWKMDSKWLSIFRLKYRPDPLKPSVHGFIEPAVEMTFSEYQRALASTKEMWKMVEIEIKQGDKK